jgi:hypothetical protein
VNGIVGRHEKGATELATKRFTNREKSFGPGDRLHLVLRQKLLLEPMIEVRYPVDRDCAQSSLDLVVKVNHQVSICVYIALAHSICTERRPRADCLAAHKWNDGMS